MGKPKDLTGIRFGRLVALEITEDKSSNGAYLWHCLCDCGKSKNIPGCNLRRGVANSCGCLKREALQSLIESKGGSIHGMKDSSTYSSWASLITRSRSETLKNYEDVGVCEEWDPRVGGSFLNFLRDMGERPEGCSINRIKGSKIYSKETCEWASRSLQGYDQKVNTRNKTGKTGVHQKKDGKFRAKITKDHKVIFLGDFETLEEAVSARKKAEIEYYGFIKE